MKESDYAAMNDAKLIGVTEQILYPLIETMIQDKLAELTNIIRAGDSSLIAPAAYIAALQDVRTRLQQIQKKGNKIIANQEPLR